LSSHHHDQTGVKPPEKAQPQMSQKTVERGIPMQHRPREQVITGIKRPRLSQQHEPAASGSWLDPSISQVGFRTPANLPPPAAAAPQNISACITQHAQRPGPAHGGFVTNYNPSLIRRQQALDRSVDTESTIGHPYASMSQPSTLRDDAGFRIDGSQPRGEVIGGVQEDSEPEEGEIEEGEIL
jgi:hypothetical protein